MNMIFSIRLLSLTSAFVALNVGRINAFSVGKVKLIPYRKPQSKLHLSSNKQIAAGDGAKKLVHLEVIATTCLTSQEVPIVLPQIISSVGDSFGMEVITGEDSKHDIIHLHINPVSESVPGATGRVILLSLNNVANDWTEDDERLEPFKNAISQQIDSLVGFRIEQPILVSVVPNFDHKATRKESLIIDSVRQIIKNEVSLYDLCTPIGSSHCAERKREEIVPVTHIEIDGAHITDHFSGEEVWDTSSILVFDDFVDHSLRERLLDVVNKRSKEYDWDDKNNGPDTSRWTKGGLVDIFNESETTSTSWGLTEDATHDLCFNHHDAISEVEEKISEYFHEFIVSRLPEAVLGSCVSPLTANAPTFGDSFSYHIDADPNQTPPSPWTDVFGRYFNRVKGKPRFISCLMYLNDEWNDEFGAPTEFLDPPTNETYQVYPRPGRVVMMDQDITHTVVAPNEVAGSNPRYSLVWKLIIHPKESRQSMKLPVNDSTQSIQVGSAR